MSKKEQIEIANIIKNCFIEESRKESNKMYKWQELPVFDSVISSLAEALSNAGYHKTIWHKVADGDLPMRAGQYLCFTRTGRYACFNYSLVDNAFLEQDTLDKEFYITNQAVAWTELPKYKE